MRNLRRPVQQRNDALLYLTIVNCQAFMLPKTFRPRLNHELFNVSGRISTVDKQAPLKGAAALSNRS
jgi:hypothetical protein